MRKAPPPLRASGLWRPLCSADAMHRVGSKNQPNDDPGQATRKESRALAPSQPKALAVGRLRLRSWESSPPSINLGEGCKFRGQ